ncbi:MAG: TRAP transporter small permease [Chloroflexi bacterium]|nr:TRAP transporter small permease [Chloroflexota bacterium]
MSELTVQEANAGAHDRTGPAASREPGILAGIAAVRGVIERIGDLMNDAAGYIYYAIAALVTFDVFARKYLGFSSQGTTELSGYMLAVGITWGLAHTLTAKGHIRVDVFVMKLPLKIRAYLHFISLALLTFMGVFFAWRSWDLVAESMLFNAKDVSILSIPLIYPQSIWAVGITAFAVMTVILCIQVVVLLALGRRAEVDRMLGPRSVEEETREALEAAGLSEEEQRRAEAVLAQR